MIYHNEPISSVLKELETNTENGLSSSDVPFLLAEHGENKLKEKKKKTNFQRFLDFNSACCSNHLFCHCLRGR